MGQVYNFENDRPTSTRRKKPVYGRAPADGDELLTLKETAKVLKASENAMYNLFNETDFPAKKMPKIGWRVRRSDLFNYMENLPKYGDE